MSVEGLPKDVKTLLFGFLDDDRDAFALRGTCRTFRAASEDVPVVRKTLEEQRLRAEREERRRHENAREQCCRALVFVLTCCCCCGQLNVDDQEGD
jgi:hypothetical protein